MNNFLRLSAACSILLALVGCADPNLKALQTNIHSLNQLEPGVLAQTNKVGNDVLTLREDIGETQPSLTDQTNQLISNADSTSWGKTFTALDSYASGLVALSGSDTDSFSTSGEALAKQLSSTGESLKFLSKSSSGEFRIIATGVIEIGNAVTQYYGQHQILLIMKNADPHVGDVCDQMNLLLASLTKTIAANYIILDATSQHGLDTIHSIPGRIIFSDKYESVKSEKQPLLDQLAALSKALASVKQAHNKIATATANSSKQDIKNAINDLQQQVKNTQAIYKSLGTTAAATTTSGTN